MVANRDTPNRAGGGYALGELDLDVSTPNAQRQGLRHTPAPPARRGGTDNLDLGEGGQLEAALELDSHPQAASSNDNWRGRTDHFASDGAGDDPLNPMANLPLPELEDVPRHTRLQGSSAQRRADAQAQSPEHLAERLAAHAPAPRGWLSCIPYAFRVLHRQQQLRAERKQAVAERAALAARLEEALADLGRALAAQPAEQLGPVTAELQAVLAARGAADSADQQAATARKDAEAQLRDLDQHVAKLKEAVAPYEQAAKRATDEHKTMEAALAKAEAMRSRIDIELRAMEGAEAPVDPNKVLALNASRADRDAQVDTARTELAAAAQRQAEARRALADQQSEADRTQQQRRKLVDQIGKMQAKLDNEIHGAEGQLVSQLQSLARAALLSGVDALGGDRAKRARDLERLHSEQLEQEHLYALALKSHHQGAVWRGLSLVGVSLVGLVAGLIALS